MNKNKRITSLLIAATIILINVHCVFGQEWEQVELPEGVVARTIHFHDSDIYLGTESGVYYSNDNCESWEFLGLENKTITAIIFTSNEELFVGGSYDIFKYLGNYEWGLVFSGSNNVECFHESFNGFLNEGTWGRINRSINGGQTWESVLETSNAEVIKDIDENSDGVLFAGSIAFMYVPGGFYRSDDNGENWSLVSLNYHFISSIEINSYDTIFVGTRGHYNTGGGRVFKSLDRNGSSWKLIFENNLVASMTMNNDDVIAIGCATYGKIYPGGIYKSYDNGTTWIDISSNLPTRYIHKVAFDIQNNLYGITYPNYELYRSIDPINNHSYNQANDNPAINVFPNPAKEFITIYLPNIEDKLHGKILNTKGLVLHEFELNKKVRVTKVQVNSLKKGIYFVIVRNKSEYYQSKFIKY